MLKIEWSLGLIYTSFGGTDVTWKEFYVSKVKLIMKIVNGET